MILSDLKMVSLGCWQGTLNYNGRAVIVIGDSRDECIVNAVELFPDLEVKYKVKYILTGKSIFFRGRELWQIQRPNGDLGGHIECEQNLSQEGGCWVYQGGRVFDNASVVDNAQVFGVVYGNATISGGAMIGSAADINSGYHIKDII